MKQVLSATPKSKQKLFFLGFFILILAIVVFYGYFRAAPPIDDQQNLPKIEITPSSFDFGEIEFGRVVEYTFKIKNSGTEVLEIKRVATSCGCTTAKAAKNLINPGEEADLLVKYDTAAMGDGPHGKGKQERIIYVKNNDPITPQIQVTISALVQ